MKMMIRVQLTIITIIISLSKSSIKIPVLCSFFEKLYLIFGPVWTDLYKNSSNFTSVLVRMFMNKSLFLILLQFESRLFGLLTTLASILCLKNFSTGIPS